MNKPTKRDRDVNRLVKKATEALYALRPKMNDPPGMMAWNDLEDALAPFTKEPK